MSYDNRLKIKQEDFILLKTAIEEIPKDLVLKQKEKLQTLNKFKKTFCWETRFVWDLLFLTKNVSDILSQLYKYLDDSHIETALKRIAIELNFLDEKHEQN